MVRISKRMQQAGKAVDKNQTYPLAEAIQQIAKFPTVKFDETVELHFRLNVDPKSSDQLIRGTVILPHGTGKKVKVAVFCKGDNLKKATESGADIVGAEDLIDKVAKGFLDFDRAIATPDMMRDLSKLGKILGPRGLMPSPKSGTVTTDIEKAIKEVKKGKIEFKTDKLAGIHVGIGKRSFSQDQLLDNANCVMEAILQVKPASIKGNLLKSAFLATTMGPGVKIAI
ncbi:MAG: 50S ribosomal protein L1 [Candidatus Omnitrophota bacterium]